MIFIKKVSTQSLLLLLLLLLLLQEACFAFLIAAVHNAILPVHVNFSKIQTYSKEPKAPLAL